jgi:signal transduction histidine kinase
MTRFLTAAFTRRTWAECLYALLALPAGLIGVGYLVVSLYVGVGLAITLVGLPLLASAVVGARGLGAAHRGLARVLLRTAVPGPAPLHRQPGVFGWIRTGLTDVAGWRALAFLLLSGPAGALSFVLAVAFWGYGLGALAYPGYYRLLPTQMDSHGHAHRGGAVLGDFYLDTWPRAALAAAAGLLLLLLAPWVVRAAVYPARLLVRALLGPTRGAQRLRTLERTRARAVENEAATLRRIERDLHDGAQAQLVALAMNLGMAREKLGTQADPQARELLDTAHRNAKEALVELRDLARGFHPPVLDKGLEAALATLVARSPVPVRLVVELPARPSPAIETIAYFCAAELLANVAKHSGARHALVEVAAAEGGIRLRVADDGAGGARPAATGTGLAGLADRVRTVDGRLELSSPPGGPTIVTVSLPAEADPCAS